VDSEKRGGGVMPADERRIGYTHIERSITPFRCALWVGLAFLVEAIRWRSILYGAIALIIFAWCTLEGITIIGAYKYLNERSTRLSNLRRLMIGD
jgi:hypothetical protein